MSESRSGEPAERAASPGPSPGAGEGQYFYGVVRARAWRVGRTSEGEPEPLERVRFRDIEALVRPCHFELPPLDEAHVLAHQRTVESVMRGSTILPAPYGVVFRGRRQVVSLLQDQYLVLDEGLSLLDGHWELRLHLAPAVPTEEVAGLADVASTVYSELRRLARAAAPFPREKKRLLSAAFLVDRTRLTDFMERSDELGNGHPELTFDLTGPWPAYDFVRFV